MDTIATYKVVWGETKESVVIPIASDSFFLTVVFDNERKLGKLFGFSHIRSSGYNYHSALNGTNLRYTLHTHFPIQYVYNPKTDERLPMQNIDVIHNLSTRKVTYINKDIQLKTSLEYSLVSGDDHLWNICLAADTKIQLPESRLQKLEWFTMMSTHSCLETEERTLHLETYTDSQFTSVMHYSEKGVLVLSMDDSTHDLLELYKVFDFFYMYSPCGYIAEILLSRGDSTIVEMLEDINRYSVLRQRFVQMMKSGFSKTVLTAIREKATVLSDLVASLFDIIPLDSYIRTSVQKKMHKYPVEFEDEGQGISVPIKDGSDGELSLDVDSDTSGFTDTDSDDLY